MSLDFDYRNPGFPKTSGQQLFIELFSFIGTLAVVWLFVKYVDKEKFIEIGLHFKNRINEFWTGLLIGFMIMILGFGVLEVLDEIQFQEVAFSFKEISFSILLFVLVSLTEEMWFRGYVLQNLMYSFNKYLALIISSTLFSLMHWFNPEFGIIGLLNIFLAGILLGITYIHTKNLWFPIALHFSWNFFQTFLGFNVSGQNAYSVVTFKIEKSTILNGGAFGFEGSILSLIAITISIFAIIIYYNRKEVISTSVPRK